MEGCVLVERRRPLAAKACSAAESTAGQELHNLVEAGPLAWLPGHAQQSQLLELWGCVRWEFQALALDGDVEDDLHLEEPRPGPVARPHLPEKHAKGVDVGCLAELACRGPRASRPVQKRCATGISPQIRQHCCRCRKGETCRWAGGRCARAVHQGCFELTQMRQLRYQSLPSSVVTTYLCSRCSSIQKCNDV